MFAIENITRSSLFSEAFSVSEGTVHTDFGSHAFVKLTKDSKEVVLSQTEFEWLTASLESRENKNDYTVMTSGCKIFEVQHYINKCTDEEGFLLTVTYPGSQKNLQLECSEAQNVIKFPKQFKPMHMSFECDRLSSFSNWQNNCVSKVDLAKAGFFSMHDGDRVKCFSCQTVIFDWKKGESAFEEHKKHNPSCAFIKCISKGNDVAGNK